MRMRTNQRVRAFPDRFVFCTGLPALLSIACTGLWMVLHFECEPMQTLTKPDLVVGLLNPEASFYVKNNV
jgi:hypothetical protein